MTFRGERDLGTRAGHLFASVREEFICAVPDLTSFSQLDVARRAAESWTRGSGGPQSCRKLCGPAVLAGADSREVLHDLVARGVQVRIATTAIPHETFIIDRRYAILAGRPVVGEREYTVTAGAGLVGAVYSLFDAAWASATDLAVFLRGEQPQLDDDSRTVLRALGSGATDEAAARGLGMSLRTYRRRVAELLDALGAGSRFQAGVRAGEMGLT